MKLAGAFVLVAGAVVAVAGQTTRTVWDGVYSDAQAARGKKSYITNCAACHQEGLQGADLAPALKGDEFLPHFTNSRVTVSPQAARRV